jgi:hypothetical protein
MAKRKSYFAGFKQDEDGVTSLEMVIASSVFIVIFGWMLETGFVLMRYVMLEHGLSTAARDVRVNGIPESATTNAQAHDYIRNKICSNVGIIKDCETTLFLELISVDPATGVPSTEPTCIDRTATVNPLTDLPLVVDGARTAANIQSVMFMRACVVIDTILPASLAMPFAYDRSGGVALISVNAYINEPS